MSKKHSEQSNLSLKGHHAIHIFDDTVLIEQPIGSGLMYSANGNSLGQYVAVSNGKWEKLLDASDSPQQSEDSDN